MVFACLNLSHSQDYGFRVPTTSWDESDVLWALKVHLQRVYFPHRSFVREKRKQSGTDQPTGNLLYNYASMRLLRGKVYVFQDAL